MPGPAVSRTPPGLWVGRWGAGTTRRTRAGKRAPPPRARAARRNRGADVAAPKSCREGARTVRSPDAREPISRPALRFPYAREEPVFRLPVL
ncbi:hypothetical protein GCM10010515_21790 [Streptomyces fructofermentans]|uniref:Uncharacterized protein n=1 Tax=Streptomyces fructofermentans TaxID=152141 RepID=A0A918K907_9ACTN|nr:hypothetical protein GCM10010515_21790 [Streptomyces fructofermentans]